MYHYQNKKLKKSRPKSKLFLLLAQIYAYLYPMAKRWKHHFHGGVFPNYQKDLSTHHPLTENILPKILILPLQQHVGLETKPLVTIGDKVLKNQCLADTEKGLSSPIHAPTSGKILDIKPHPGTHPSGLPQLCIFLEPDGQNKTLENVLQVDKTHPDTPEALKNIVHKAGIVGMGGAGFPTFAKFPDQKNQIKTLLINGAECEPFITCDDIYMQQKADDIIQGALIVAQALGATQIICGIENNKPLAIQAMQKAAENTHIRIQPVPTVYPMGGQKQLTKELTGIEMPAGAHAIDIGLLMMNVQTFGAIYHAVTFGTPLTQRYLTVSGDHLKYPQNINAMIGTPFKELIQLAQPKDNQPVELIMGGPMMGVEMPHDNVPVIKTTNCILVNLAVPTQDALPCIRCGECMDACPINLLPQQMYWHSRAEDYDKVEKLHVFDCIECGCCSFVCPSNIPLVQYYRHAKAEIKHQKAEDKAAQLAKQRHEAKLARLQAEADAKAARMLAKKAAVKKQAAQNATEATPQKTDAKKSAAARAAAARKAAAAKKATQKPTTESKTTPTNQPTAPEPTAQAPTLSARDRAIAAAKKRANANNAKKATTDKATDKPTDKPATQATPDQATPTTETTPPPLSTDDKRKAAMAAAKKRAAERKAAKLAQEKPE